MINGEKYVTYNAFDYNNPNILNGYIGTGDKYQSYPTNGMVCVPITQGSKYEISGIIRISSSLSIRWGTFTTIPTDNTQTIRTGTFAQNETQEITAESNENYIAIMFCGDSDYNSYRSVESAYAANCLNLHIDTLHWTDTPIPTRKLHNKTDIITSLPVDIYTDGQNASADIIGNMVQNGTPTPTTPITPSETGERTENLFDYTTTTDGYEISLGDFIPNANWCVSDYIPVIAGRKYYGRNTGGSVILYDSQKNKIRGSGGLTTTGVTVDTNGAYIRINLEIGNKPIAAVSVDSKKPYEPYGYKLDIKSGSTTTPVYLGQVQSTRKIYRRVFNGTEDFTSVTVTGGLAFLYIPEKTPNKWNTANNIVSSHFKSEYANNDGNIYFTSNRMVLINLSCATVEEFKQYLAQQYAAGTPVTVWYALAESTTTTLNEPLRKISTYADSVSVTNIPTTAGGIEFDVDTSLKPSEVDLMYHGWHDISPKSKSANLFDKNATPYSTTGFITIEGTLTEYANWSVSDYIEVSANTQYTVSGMNTTAVYASLCYYTEDKTYISGVRYNSALEVTFTTPTNCKFVLVSYHNSKINNVMLNTGSTALPYAPYWE